MFSNTMAKHLFFSKFITLKKDEESIELELGLAEHPLMSDADMDTDVLMYEPKDDEQILQAISKIEFEQKMEWGGPSFDIEGEDISCATGLKYCRPTAEDSDVREMASYPQGKGKEILWILMFEGLKKEIACDLELYVFFRDSMGDIRRLHYFEHDIPFRIPHSHNGTFCTLHILRKDRKSMECGRYYLAFRLRKSKGGYIGSPYIQYINIVPSKGYTLQVESDMVGMDSIYRQMSMLAKQKMFNDNRLAMNLQPAPINLHAAVMGDKGSGKTSFAQVLFDFYTQNKLIPEDGYLNIVDARHWTGLNEDLSSMDSDFSLASGGMLYVENAASMIAFDSRVNKYYVVEALANRLREKSNDTAVILVDTPERITMLLAIADLKSYIRQIYKLPTLDIEQMMAIAERDCKRRGFVITPGARNNMISYLSSLPNATTTDVNVLIDEMIMNMSMRVINASQELFQDTKTLSELLEEDVPQPKIGQYDLSLKKLNNLVGLNKLKYNIESHLNLVRFTQLRQKNGLKATMPPLHMIFTGNPGTGKTTVASLLGEIYASIGILKTGKVISVDRKKLVGQYIGDTEANTRQVLQQAHGNILLIDEAYTLVGDPDDKKDFGPKVLDCLLEELGKEQTDMIIILAGYPEEMEKMLQANKGLSSRFPYTFHFEDYTEDELLEIALRTAAQSGYTFSEDAVKRLKTLIHREMERGKGRNKERFGNARFITRLISSRIIPNMSRRILSPATVASTPQQLSLIEASDIPTSVQDADMTIDEAEVNRILKQLDEMVGREEVKRTLHNLVTLARTKQANGEDLSDTIPLQWTFTGSTGTGKSSVARLLAQLLHACHLISSDKMTQLRMPQTPSNTWTSYDIDQLLRETMKQSGQGLLFIDLDDIANSHIDVQWFRCKLTSLTAEMPGSYAFVIAVDDNRLQTSPIDVPISTSTIHFEDYTAEELIAILRQRLDKRGYSITDEALAELDRHIRMLCDNRSSGFANARTIKHIYIAVTSAAELRQNASPQPVITKEDVQSIKWKKLNSHRIGFGA